MFNTMGNTFREKKVIALVLFQLITTTAMAGGPADVNNCGHQKKHTDAVQLPSFGPSMYLHPDGSKVDRKYSGCQNVWLEDGFQLVQVKYKNGAIDTYKTWDPKTKKAVSCTYADGRVSKGDPSLENCPSPTGFPLHNSGKAK